MQTQLSAAHAPSRGQTAQCLMLEWPLLTQAAHTGINTPAHACMDKIIVCMLWVCKHELSHACMQASRTDNTTHELFFYYLTLSGYLHHTGILWPQRSKLAVCPPPRWPLLRLAGETPWGASLVGIQKHTQIHTQDIRTNRLTLVINMLSQNPRKNAYSVQVFLYRLYFTCLVTGVSHTQSQTQNVQ